MKTKYKILIGILVLFIAVRIYLPFGVIKYVNKLLVDLPGYTGSISDVDLQIYKGSYSIDSLNILKEDSTVAVPFFLSNRIDISIEWKAIFKGAIVGELEFFEPELNFVASEDTTASQYGEEVDWTEPIKELLPLKINRFSISNGSIFFKNLESEPKVDVFLKDFDLVATNLSNASSEESKLPSHLTVSAQSIGGGNLSVEGNLNLLKKIPDVDINFKFEEVELPALNDFLRVYAKLDAESGVFNLFSEIVINDGQLTGYVKPLLSEVKILNWSEDNDQPLRLIWETFVTLITESLENQKENQLATKVPLEGDLNDPNVKILPTIWSVFRNGFVQAFNLSIDDTVEFEDTEK